MADTTELKNIVRLGTVMSVDKAKMTARVKFGDKGGITSGALHILKHPVSIVPEKDGATEGRTAQAELKYDVSGTTKTEKHEHAAYVKDWVPEINDMVLCIMMPDGDGDGYIVGGV